MSGKLQIIITIIIKTVDKYNLIKISYSVDIFLYINICQFISNVLLDICQQSSFLIRKYLYPRVSSYFYILFWIFLFLLSFIMAMYISTIIFIFIGIFTSNVYSSCMQGELVSQVTSMLFYSIKILSLIFDFKL